MSEQPIISTRQKQKLKKYVVFALMAVIFTGCIWLIFAPSEADKAKERQGSGFNADIPDPDDGGLIGNKKDAYEQEQMQKRQKDRMQSLQGYMDMLEGETEGEQISLSLTDETEAYPSVQAQGQKTSINSSVSAYQDINRTLGSFYEQPEDDPEKEEMKKKLDELESRLKEKESRQDIIDEQLTLMEKSYELAAKYMPQGQQQENNNSLKNKIENYSNKSSGNNGKTKVAPIRQIQNQTVSALAQNLSDEEFFRMYGESRHLGFNTMDGFTGISEKNTISAVIHDDQTVVDGQVTRLRLIEPFMAGTTIIPQHTIITGIAKVQGERLDIQISSIEYQGTIIPVEMITYDTDGQRGIHIPGSLEMNAAKEIIANMGNSVGTSFTMTQSAGSQLASDLTKGTIQGVSAYTQKKIRQVKVTLKSGYRVMLMPKTN